ncbi:hypothetical protein HMF8227_01058 [Saliniradius amylolyticus]|uniref:Lipoprotein n=1 Tax=Saliniradius amylolyticus TaxID=2183582 RepID=A0A2S2E1L6_9ALTE|nr:hypothetical protein [Saliniradius amylolyticus]AWL11545.1 hypothetical protein HMF8227_01058 [Saliniradius amylolyticus]
MRIIVISAMVALGLTGCGGANSNYNLNALHSDHGKLFQVIKYDGRKDIDYSYCDSQSQLYKTRIHRIDNSEFISLKCRNEFNHRTNASSTFYKYSRVFKNGAVRFCGWKDFKTNNGQTTMNKGTSGKCAEFKFW